MLAVVVSMPAAASCAFASVTNWATVSSAVVGVIVTVAVGGVPEVVGPVICRDVVDETVPEEVNVRV